MLDTILSDAETLLIKIDEATASDDYAQASALAEKLNEKIEALRTAPPAEAAQFRDRIAAIFKRISDNMDNAAVEQEQVRNELVKFRKGAAGISAYRSNSGRLGSGGTRK